MTDVLIQPPLHHWAPAPLSAAASHAAGHRLLIATGHQAALWHPGILAKDMAMVAAARRHGAGICHLVVDQDVNPALTLKLPIQRADRLGVHTVQLARQQVGIPTGCHDPVDPAGVVQVLQQTQQTLGENLRADLSWLIQAWQQAGDQGQSLAEQIGAVTAALFEPLIGPVPMVLVSDLARQDAFQAMVAEMLHDARACVRSYNQAVARVPQAGIPPLALERDRVALPLWATGLGQPRQGVYADLGDSRPLLTLEDGTPLEQHSQLALAPRALALTALMRDQLCSLFIHGTGGAIYDQAAEQWWQSWRGRSLAPRVTVTAHVYLDFDVPVHSADELARAVWRRRYVRVNVDRVLGLDDPLSREKRDLLAHMDDDRDKARRWAAFQRIKQINAQLANQHGRELIAQADGQLTQVHLGVANARVAGMRDWCFALYPQQTLKALAERIEEAALAPSP